MSSRTQISVPRVRLDEAAWAVFEQLAVAVAVADIRTGRFLRANRGMAALTGYTVEELAEKTVLDIAPPEERALIRAEFSRLLRRESQRYTAERRYISKDGTPRWADVSVTVLANSSDEPQALAVLQDVTTRHQIQLALARSKERFEIALSHAPVILFNHDLALRYTWIHNAVWRKPEAFIGRTDAEIFPQQTAAPLMAFKRLVLETGRGERAEMQLSFGVIDACYDMIVEPIRDDSGRITGLACAAIDLTDRRRAERERDHLLDSERAARADAERAGRMKDEFLATLSHELRTPLNAMLGWAQVLQHHATDARVLRGLQVIERNVRVQSQLIDDLLDMSRILSGKVRLMLEPLELGPLVEAAVETLRPSAELKGIDLTCTRGLSTSGLVRADANRLQQIVLNLLSNAIKFTPTAGKVSVRVEAAHGERRIIISDTGCGIDSEFLPHVFERFRQADASSTRRHGGLGLGLAITRHLVEMHGGRVEAHSEGVDHGSVFTVALPVIEAVLPDESASTLRGRRPAQPVVLDGIRVLVVDDDADARELADHVLRERGAEVETAASVSEALDALRRSLPDVLVSDISMPDTDGYELIAQVRGSVEPLAGLPAIALTAFARGEDQVRALAAGYDAHLSKPVDSRDLADVIATLVRGVKGN
jgi:PAS domain S-box-containing protein